MEEHVLLNAPRQVALDGRRYRVLCEKWDVLTRDSADGLPHGIERSFFDSSVVEVERSLELEIYPLFIKWQADEAAKHGHKVASPRSQSTNTLPDADGEPKLRRNLSGPLDLSGAFSKLGNRRSSRSKSPGPPK